jgi:hypothetical protein
MTGLILQAFSKIKNFVTGPGDRQRQPFGREGSHNNNGDVAAYRLARRLGRLEEEEEEEGQGEGVVGGPSSSNLRGRAASFLGFIPFGRGKESVFSGRKRRADERILE